MLITIPSCGRASLAKQVTLRNFTRMKLKRQPVLCVPANEGRRYRNNLPGADIAEVPEEIVGIAATREWILYELSRKRGDERVLMIDDDMDFCYREDINSPKLTMITEAKELDRMLDLMDQWIDEGFMHVGVSPRQGNNHFPAAMDFDEAGKPRLYRDVGRMMNFYAYDMKRLRKINVNVRRNKVMHDFDLTLQLLRSGYANRVSYEFCWNQRGSGAEGGCSTYRNAAMQKESAEQLKRDHKDFVTIKLKTSKAGWAGMEERFDVIVAWKKAFEEGQTR